MKRKILFQFLFVGGLAAIFTTLKSDSNGKYNGGTSCSSCHGNMNTNTTVVLTGLPSTFVTGQTYPLSFAISNATNTKAGFNISTSAGTFTAGSGSKVNGAKTQITHTTPKSAASGTTTFDFTWTAPATIGAVTFLAVGNAVNGDGQDNSSDQWNSTTKTVSGSFPASVNDVEKLALKCYPNPTTNVLTIDNINKFNHVIVFDMTGQQQQVSISYNSNNSCSINCGSLASGMYFVHASIDGKIATTTFEKK